jgi:hypothetical protein
VARCYIQKSNNTHQKAAFWDVARAVWYVLPVSGAFIASVIGAEAGSTSENDGENLAD